MLAWAIIATVLFLMALVLLFLAAGKRGELEMSNSVLHSRLRLLEEQKNAVERKYNELYRKVRERSETKIDKGA